MTNQFIVQSFEGARRNDLPDWQALVVLAALSAEPETFDELDVAISRYWSGEPLFGIEQQVGEIHLSLPEQQWCVVDLVGRTVIAGNGAELPDPHGAYQADETDVIEGFHVVWLDTPGDWLFRKADGDWRTTLTSRAAAGRARQRIDVRAVLFGTPLLDLLAERALAAPAPSADEEEEYQRIRAIHADWLMTPREDLLQRAPRELLLAGRERLSRDVEHRCEQWSLQRFAPPGLPPDSVARRLGGFGTTEVVLYFDLVRALLEEARAWVRNKPSGDKPMLIEHLEARREDWLHSPHEDGSSLMTPAELIESERRRIPITADGAHLHDGCPVCEGLASGDLGPMFMHFDGHHLELEDEFAFSLLETREEWEREREEYRRFSEEMDRKAAERKARGDPEHDSVWGSSYVNWDGLGEAGFSPELMRSMIGFPLSELGTDLEEANVASDRDALNAAYAAFLSAQDAVSLKSAVHELCDRLESVAVKNPKLTPKCADLQSRLAELLRAQS